MGYYGGALRIHGHANSADGGTLGVSTRLTSGLLKNFLSYKNPDFACDSTVSKRVILNDNNVTAGETIVVFPDNELRTLSGSGSALRNCILTTTGAQTGTLASGLAPSVSLTNDNWYSFYACKSLDDSTNAVILANQLAPIPTNYTTLNTNFGVNSWRYLGTLRYGDSSADANHPLLSRNHGGTVLFFNQATSPAGYVTSSPGILLKSGAITSYSLAGDISLGYGDLQIPNHLSMGLFVVNVASGLATTAIELNCAYGAHKKFNLNASDPQAAHIWSTVSVTGSMRLINVTADASTNIEIFLAGFYDPLLGALEPLVAG